MGGLNTSNSNTQQSSNGIISGATSGTTTQNPWEPAVPAIQGLLNKLTGQIGNVGISPAQNEALAGLGEAGKSVAPLGAGATSYAQGLINGSAASPYTAALSEYQKRLQPMADSTNWGGQNPAFRSYLDTVGDSVAGRVNSMFAGSGRDLSGANQGAVAKGIAEATAPIIAQQFNADRDASRSAADALYGAQTGTANAVDNLRSKGVGLIPNVLSAATAAPNTILEAESKRTGIPAQQLGLLASIGVPIAGLGKTGTTSGTTSGTQQSWGSSNTQSTPSMLSTAMNLGQFLFGI